MASTRSLVPPTRPVTRGGGFLKGLQAALAATSDPQAALVASSPARLDFLKELCLRAGLGSDRMQLFVTDHAAAGLDARGYSLLILDPSVEELTRSAFKVMARAKRPSCKVMEIKKWSVEPPI